MTPPERPTLKVALIDFDFRQKLAGQKAALTQHEEKKESTPVVTSRKMAVKKPPAAVKVAKEKPKHVNIVRNWKTGDKALDFELAFDDEGDPRVDCQDADNDEPTELAVDLDGLDEVIQILQEIRTNAVRIMSGDIRPEDTVMPEDDDEEEEEEEEEDE
jgi:hypothetical protein